MMTYNRGDVVLVGFIFSDETGAKQRPAVVISSDSYHKSRQEAVISAITSNTDRILFGDHVITYWQRAGLLYPSVATAIIRTVKQNMIIKKLGKISKTDLNAIEIKLREVMALS